MDSIARENRTMYTGIGYFRESSHEKRLLEKKIDKVAKIIKEHADKKAPGLYELVELTCKAVSAKSCAELFFEEPEKLREILIIKYGDAYSAGFVVKYILLKPVLSYLGVEELGDELYDLFMGNPLEFKRRIKKLLQKQ